MAKILVTGATGFIGSYVVNELLKRDHEVIATSRTRDHAVVKEWFNNVDYIEADLLAMTDNDSENFAKYFHQPQAVIHLAWPGLPNYSELFHIERNLYSDYRFIKNLVLNGVTDITVTGTCLEYGIREGCLTEDMHTDPGNSYGIAKDTLRKFLQQFQLKHNFDLKWVRLFYMYGSGQNPASLLAQLDEALYNNEKVFNMSGGEQERDYLPVQVIASYIADIALQNKVSGIINCCSGKPVSVKTLVVQHLKERNRSIELNLGYYPYPVYEPMKFWGSNSKLNEIFSNKTN